MVPFACFLLILFWHFLWLYLIFDKDGGDKEREQGNEHTTKCQPAGKLVAFLLVWVMPKSQAGHLTTCCSITDFSIDP